MANQYRKLPFQGGQPRDVAEIVNNIMEGKINSTGTVTLATGGATSTTIEDRRIGPESIILLMATSLSSAAANKYPFGFFYNTANQTFTADTPTVAVLNSSQYLYGMSLSSNQMTVDYAGLYNVHAECTFVNSSSQIHDAFIWLRVNGTDVPNSTSWFGVSDKQGSNVGATISSVDMPVDLSASDYLEVMIAVDDAVVSLLANAASTSPYAKPASESTKVEVYMVQPSEETGSAFEPYISARTKGQATITHLPNSVSGKTFDYLIIG